MGVGVGEVGPVAVLGVEVVGVLADDGDLPGGLDGQHARILQQRDGGAGGAQGGVQMLGAAHAAGYAGFLRLFEEVHAEFHRQDVAHRLVQHGFLHPAGLHRIDRRLVEAGGGHDHVVAGGGGLHRGVLEGFRHMLLGHQGFAVVPVGDDEAVKAQLLPEDGLHGLGVSGEGVAVDGAVGSHNRGAARVNGALEGRQEDFLQLAVGHLGVHGVAGAHGFAVADVVLGAGQDGVGGVQAVALVALHDGVAHFARQIGILAEGLVDAAPAGIAAQAQNGGEGPVQTVGSHLAGGDAAHFLHDVGVPGAGGGQLGGEDGGLVLQAVAVDGVDAEDHRDAQAAVLHGGALHLAGVVAQHMQEGARAQSGPAQALLAAHDGVGDLHHLRDLFLQRHLRKQLLHAEPDGFSGQHICTSVCAPEGVILYPLSYMERAEIAIPEINYACFSSYTAGERRPASYFCMQMSMTRQIRALKERVI